MFIGLEIRFRVYCSRYTKSRGTFRGFPREEDPVLVPFSHSLPLHPLSPSLRPPSLALPLSLSPSLPLSLRPCARTGKIGEPSGVFRARRIPCLSRPAISEGPIDVWSERFSSGISCRTAVVFRVLGFGFRCVGLWVFSFGISCGERLRLRIRVGCTGWGVGWRFEV